jgi:GTP1/Obg family GTP-binding protein
MFGNAIDSVILAAALAITATGCSVDAEYREINKLNASIIEELSAAKTPKEKMSVWKSRRGRLQDAHAAAKAAKGMLSIGMDDETLEELNRLEPELRALVDDIAPGEYDKIVE